MKTHPFSSSPSQAAAACCRSLRRPATVYRVRCKRAARGDPLGVPLPSPDPLPRPQRAAVFSRDANPSHSGADPPPARDSEGLPKKMGKPEMSTLVNQTTSMSSLYSVVCQSFEERGRAREGRHAA
jgi:hypothetical protein